MHTLMTAEGRRLQLDIDRLGRNLPTNTRPCGLRQRAKSAFIRELHAYKCERLEAVQDEVKRSRTQLLDNRRDPRNP